MPTTTELYRPPEFYAVQRLTRSEFYAIVEGMEQRGERTRGIERLEGVVHMPAAIRADQHGEPQLWISSWLGAYSAATPGVQGVGNATAQLEADSDPEPEAILRIRPEYGGQSSTDHRGYIDGPPELVVEIAGYTAKTDL